MFERLILLITVLVTMPVAAEELDLEKDAYGLGVHSDQYGRPWKSEPGQELKKDAYGLGVHSDQYGRPIQQKPPTASQPFGVLEPFGTGK
jgi:hypothetical protein